VRTESTETIDGPNGPGGVETVRVRERDLVDDVTDGYELRCRGGRLAAALRAEGGITQGELLRQEQRAGVVPAAQLVGKGDESGMGEEDELPHARGPEEIGMEDVGPQGASGSERMVRTRRWGCRVLMLRLLLGRRIAAKPDPSPASADFYAKEMPREARSRSTNDPEKRSRRGPCWARGRNSRLILQTQLAEPDVDIELVDADGKAEGEAQDRRARREQRR
jgi:hypothetical protein